MKKLTWKRGNWIATSAMAAITSAFLWLVFLPQMKSIRALQADMRVKEDFIAQESGLSAQLAVNDADRRETQAFIDTWVVRSPSSQRVAALFGRISESATATQVTLTRFEPQPVVEMESLRQIPLMLGCDGSFAAIHAWIRKVEGFPETIWVEELKLERPSEDGQDLHCEVKLAVFADKSEFSN